MNGNVPSGWASRAEREQASVAELARQAYAHVEPGPQDSGEWRRIASALDARRGSRRRVALLGALATAGSLAAGWLVLGPPGRSLVPATRPGPVAVQRAAELPTPAPTPTPAPAPTPASSMTGRDSFIRGKRGTGSTLALEDGSRIRVAPGGSARVVAQGVAGTHVVVESGRSSFEVVRQPARIAFLVDAGPYRISVVGTSFEVLWPPSGARLSVTVEEGEVLVTGPLPGGEVRLRAGQTLAAQPGGETRIAAAFPDTSTALPPSSPRPGMPQTTLPEMPAPPAALAPPPVTMALSPATIPPPAAPAVLAAAGPLPPSARGWAAAVRRGAFADVVSEAEAFGIDRCAAECMLIDLAALADAARYQGRGMTARQALLAIRARFTDTKASQVSAFLLGWLLDQVGDAEARRWFDLYAAEVTSGPYAEVALGRSMLIADRDVQSVHAHAAATTYLLRFPQGLYAARARALMKRP